MVQSRQTMNPAHPEHALLGILSLAVPEVPEAWRHAVNHGLDVVLAFSGLSLGLGYGAPVLALLLLLLPTAFPELSRPRDGLWSLPLAALAPLLLLNRLPVFSKAGLTELIATVLMARLAAEVGQGRWQSLTPDQKSALRHLPRWRHAGADVVAAVVQAAKNAWRGMARTGKAAWGVVSGWFATGASPDPVAENAPGAEPSQPIDGGAGGQGADDAPGAEPSQPVAGGDGDQGAEDANINVKDDATGGGGEAGPEQEHRAGTGLVAAVAQAARNAWSAVSSQKGPVEQRRQGQPAQKAARKQWVRPDPSNGEQGGQDGKTSPGIPDAPPATAASPAPAPVVDHAPGAEPPPQPVDAEDEHQGTGDAKANVEDPATGESGEATLEQEHLDQPAAGPVTALVEDAAPEAHSTPEPAEEAQQAQPADGDDPGDGKGVDAASDGVPGDGTPEDVERPVEPLEPETQPSEGAGAEAAGPEPEPGEKNAAEEPGTPEPGEGGTQPPQPLEGTDTPKASPADSPAPDADNSASMAVAPDDDPGHMAIADESGEGFVVTKADPAAGTLQAMADAPEAETEPPQPAGEASTQPARNGEDVVVISFDEVDEKLWGGNWGAN